ncbi:SDR family NAD(P)-dependent oxidoreductase [Actinocrispum wychmicini]|uniref:Short subunit dehydrogenase n=1 Tax=Actinocrispum wychmicini TaxID=1213861 RepID=A0A4R2JKU7_9PSEU|nr:SDR family NAD(P)-dependent oxidoreductase [Actinocrispum wychmicini]TCO59172.1 short subunit dehydrogenase [Actinocrispum wychmicini]
MPAIAIVGSGAGLGLSIAKVFGRHGFDVALIARNEEKLGGFTARLATDGVKAVGFPADVTDPQALVGALNRAADQFGGIDVLEFSVPPVDFVEALDVTVANVRPQMECVCYGAITATQAVLPAMVAAGTGTLLFTTGASSVVPRAAFGSAGIAGAALRNWVLNLHEALGEKGVYVGHVAIGAWIEGTPAPAGVVTMHPDDIAAVYWNLYTTRDQAERLVTA